VGVPEHAGFDLPEMRFSRVDVVADAGNLHPSKFASR